MPVPIDTVIPPSPNVRIFFTGILMFRFEGSGLSCDVGVPRTATASHVFSIRVTMRDRNTGDLLGTLWRQTGLLNDQDLFIENPATTRVSQYQYGETFRRNTSVSGQEKDFRWILDIEGPEFHDDTLTVDEHNTHPGIY